MGESEVLVEGSVVWIPCSQLGTTCVRLTAAKRRTGAQASARGCRCQSAIVTDRLRFMACGVPSVAIIRAALDCVHDVGATSPVRMRLAFGGRRVVKLAGWRHARRAFAAAS